MPLRITTAGLLSATLALAALAAPPPAKPPKPPAAGTEDEKPDLKNAKNLVVNGDFEEGTDTPKGWQQVDGLTTFWVKDADPKHGKVIKFDTDIYQSQGYDWWMKIANGAKAKDAPRKIETKGDKYDTLAGLDGVWYWSDFIPVEKGKSYWLTMDVKGGAILSWLFGYPNKESTAFGADAAAFQEYLQEKRTGKAPDRGRDFEPFRYKYVWKGQMPAGGSNEWKTYSRRKMPFRPTANTPNVKYVRVMIFPFWPPGTYYVDNVRLVEYPEKQ